MLHPCTELNIKGDLLSPNDIFLFHVYIVGHQVYKLKLTFTNSQGHS